MSTRTLISDAIASLASAPSVLLGPVQIGGPFTVMPTAGAAIALKSRSGSYYNFYCEGTGGVSAPIVFFKHDIDSTGVAMQVQGNSAVGGSMVSFSREGEGSNLIFRPAYPDTYIQTHLNAAAKLHFQYGTGSANADALVIQGSNPTVLLGNGTVRTAIGQDAGGSGYTGIWLGSTNAANPNVTVTSPFALLSNDAGTTTWVGAPTQINLQVGGTDVVSVTNGGLSINSGRRITMPVYVNAYTTTGQSITNVVFNQVAYNTRVSDSLSILNTTTGAITVPTAGRYFIRGSAAITFPVSTNVTICCSIYVNGSEISRGNRQDFASSSAAGTEGVITSDVLALNANDVVTVWLYQGSGANRTLNGVATDNRITLLGPF